MRRVRHLLGIQGQFLALLGTSILFSMLVSTTLSARSQWKAMVAERQLRGLAALRAWSTLGRERLLSDESVNLPMWDFVDDLRKHEPFVEEMFLLDTGGRYVMHDDQTRLGERCPPSRFASIRGLRGTSIRRGDGDGAGTMLFVQDVSASGKRIGYAAVAFSSKGIVQGIRESILFMVLGSAVVGLASMLLASALVYQISRPVRTLVEGVRRFGQTFDPQRPETADFRIEFKSRNEIGDVRDAFNAMTEQLRQNMLERERLKEATGVLRRQATTDAMTGLLNKRQFQEDYPVVLRMARERSVPLCLMLLDMDRFKQLNDTMGHGAGDKALQDLAESMRARLRSSEKAYRVGGDEFVLVAVGVDLAAARSIADRISEEYGRRKDAGNPTSISFGIVLDDGTSSPEELLKAADEEMYRVKREKKAAR